MLAVDPYFEHSIPTRPAPLDIEQPYVAPQNQFQNQNGPDPVDHYVAATVGLVGSVLGSAGFITGMALRAHHMYTSVRPAPLEQFIPQAQATYNACLNGSASSHDIGYTAVLKACQATSSFLDGTCDWNNVWNLASGIPGQCLEGLAAIDQQTLVNHQRHVANNQYGFIAMVVVVAPVAFLLSYPIGYCASRIFRNMANLCGVARGSVAHQHN